MTDYKRTKEYHERMVNHALKLLEQGDGHPAVRSALMSEFGCARGTAYRVTSKAQSIRDGQPAGDWGGKKPGAGRPRKDSPSE